MSMNKKLRSEKEVEFGFGFNDIDFSDRVLRLEIFPELPSNTTSGGDNTNGSDFVKESKVISVHVSRILLAAKSPFFYKLFKNGMRESQEKDDVTVKIHASEEAAFMDMLNSIYDKPLNATSRAELLDVLMVADKFEVTTCARFCIQLLLKLPMTRDSAVTYLELPSSVLEGEVTRPLIDAAKQHFFSRFSGFNESQQKELMSLPLCAVEAVLGTADLKVNSEEVVLDFILKWARRHYPKLEERREILTKCLLGFVCFPCLSYLKLMEIVDYPDFDYERVSRLVLKALSYKIERPKGPNSALVVRTLLPNDALANCAFPRRVYYHRRVVHFDIKKQDCHDMLLETPIIYAEPLCLGGRSFSLFAKRYTVNSADHFGLYLEMRGSGSCSLDIELASMKNPSKEFQIKVTTNHTFSDSYKQTGWWMFEWTDLFRYNNSVYFIDGILHLRAQLSISN